MEFTVKAGALADEMALVSRAVAKKETLHVLSYVLIEAVGDRLRLTATDMDVTMRSSCKAEAVRSDGSVLIHAKRLAELCNLFDQDTPIQVAALKGTTSIRAGEYRGKLPSMPVVEFPSTPAIPAALVPLPVRTFKSQLDQVAFCVSQHDPRYFTAGVYMALRDGRAVLVSTDGHRMARSSAACDTPMSASVIVPAKSVPELMSMSNGAQDLSFGASDAHLFFVAGDRALITRVIDGRFPAHERVLAGISTGASPVVANRDALIAAMRRVMAVASESTSRIVTIRFKAGEPIEVSAETTAGQSSEPVACENASYSGQIDVAGHYVLQHLSAAAIGDVELHPLAHALRLKQGASEPTSYDVAIAVMQKPVAAAK